MEASKLAAQLATVTPEERSALMRQHAAAFDAGLAWALKSHYDQWESNDPARAAAAAAALEAVAGIIDDPEAGALADWTAGMAALDAGQMEAGLARLQRAEAAFDALGRSHDAASTQVSKMIALATLGRYDEAIACGEHARDVFVAHGDLLAAGKIEQNLGNINFRRERYIEAERLFRAARERYLELDNQKQLAQIDNCLATALTARHRFREAVPLYEQALARAQAGALEITEAEIETNLGCVALFQGSYDQALDYLERSRRRYAELGLPHESARAEQELAEAYLELNLAAEAAAIFARVIPTFADLGMRADQARALAYHGRASIMLGDTRQAQASLAEAAELYRAEGNAAGAAGVRLAEAQIFYGEQRYEEALAAAAEAEGPLREVGARGRLLLASWLQGEAARALGRAVEAAARLQATLRDAAAYSMPQVAQRCHTSLGLLHIAAGDTVAAEEAFQRAIAIVEELRAPLPAEEFRTAFVGDKLTPFVEVVRLYLADDDQERVVEALRYVERARSRVLVDMLKGVLRPQVRPRDAYEADLVARIGALREELNWLYSQINRVPEGDASRAAAMMSELHEAARERETTVLELTRQLQQRAEPGLGDGVEPDVAHLRRDLGSDTALVEYFTLDDEIMAFVVTDAGIEVVRALATEAEVEVALAQLRFQIGTLRHGVKRVAAHLPELTRRAQHYLGRLYDLLLRPIEDLLDDRRLLVVPYRALHYVPFHALYDGERYVIEQREVAYAPSAQVLQHCLRLADRPSRRAVLLGVPNEQTPRVRDEIEAIAPLFPGARVLLDGQATLESLRAYAPEADIVHLACHGHFRPDNPLFSALRLGDGWLTVRDAYDLELTSKLVTLSACETGLGAVTPGDDLIGLARGFFSAGAASLIVSLWTVDDEATATMMTDFYRHLRAGDEPGAALRRAQRTMLRDHPHPFFWSPFVLLGRW